jgi:hypothetical protein
MTTRRARAGLVGLAILGCALGACGGSGSGGSTSSSPDGGPGNDAATSGSDGSSGSGGGSGGGSGSSSGGGSGGGSGSSSGGSESTCQTYASKAYSCCQSSSSCNGVTEQTFIQYCEGFLSSCPVYYSCFLSASSCAQANACPTLGDGGCS